MEKYNVRENAVFEQDPLDAEANEQFKCFRLITEMGRSMLLNGGEIFRTDEAMRYAAQALKLEDFHAYVIANGIFTSMVVNGKFYSSRIFVVPLAPIRLCRVEALNSLSRRIASGSCSLGELEQELKSIEKLEASGNRSKILASGCGSASFCYLFGGSFSDSLASFAAGVALYLFLLYVVPQISLSSIMSNIAGSALMALLCCVFYTCGFGEHLDRMTIGAIFPLVPGIALTNSIRNFLENDYLSGLIRLVDALLTAGCIAVGVGVVMRIWPVYLGGIL